MFSWPIIHRGGSCNFPLPAKIEDTAYQGVMWVLSHFKASQAQDGVPNEMLKLGIHSWLEKRNGTSPVGRQMDSSSREDGVRNLRLFGTQTFQLTCKNSTCWNLGDKAKNIVEFTNNHLALDSLNQSRQRRHPGNKLTSIRIDEVKHCCYWKPLPGF